jgi:two-component system response regulator RegX3
LRILIVEDEPSWSESPAFLLGAEGKLRDRDRSRRHLLRSRDSTVLAPTWLPDLMLPGIARHRGLPREIRTRSQVPIIMLTAKDSEVDVGRPELGADDYVTKPPTRELLRSASARGHEAGERRPMRMNNRCRSSPAMRMDVDCHTVAVRGVDTSMPPAKEYELLEVLLRTRSCVTRGQLIDRVWGPDYSATPRRSTCTSSASVQRSRRSRPTRGMPLTAHRTGYRFEP